jgi:hypothetical protein
VDLGGGGDAFSGVWALLGDGGGGGLLGSGGGASALAGGKPIAFAAAGLLMFSARAIGNSINRCQVCHCTWPVDGGHPTPICRYTTAHALDQAGSWS